MKKISLVLALMVTAVGFTQNKQDAQPKPESNTTYLNKIVHRTSSIEPIANPENNPLVTKINVLENDFKEMEAIKIQDSFLSQDASSFATKDDVFNGYIKHLQGFKTPNVYVEEIVKFPPVVEADNPRNKIKRSNGVGEAQSALDQGSIRQMRTEDSNPSTGVEIISNRNPSSKPLPNAENNPLITQINALEAALITARVAQFQQDFETTFHGVTANQGEHVGNPDFVLNNYINNLEKNLQKQGYYRRVSERLRHKNRAMVKKPGLEHKAGVTPGGKLMMQQRTNTKATTVKKKTKQ
ncbi:hypothetical protein [uncultured Dokdonia sp.]|uniref:hypothetical protein n=1 Tax=uncultured Dokdonia sp. TaxID=575653 RepID=UPI00262D4DF9|nr:hypothetical protein [uncultured Dokdonia sp.]